MKLMEDSCSIVLFLVRMLQCGVKRERFMNLALRDHVTLFIVVSIVLFFMFDPSWPIWTTSTFELTWRMPWAKVAHWWSRTLMKNWTQLLTMSLKRTSSSPALPSKSRWETKSVMWWKVSDCISRPSCRIRPTPLRSLPEHPSLISLSPWRDWRTSFWGVWSSQRNRSALLTFVLPFTGTLWLKLPPPPPTLSTLPRSRAVHDVVNLKKMDDGLQMQIK